MKGRSDVPDHPWNGTLDGLLSDEQKEELRSDLERMARQRRTAGGNLG